MWNYLNNLPPGASEYDLVGRRPPRISCCDECGVIYDVRDEVMYCCETCRQMQALEPGDDSCDSMPSN